MKGVLGVLLFAALILIVDYCLMVLEKTHPDLFVVWLVVTAIGLPLWAWACRKYKRGDFN